ncbi:YrrS family protein [Solibacillus sp. FSL H8-0538]|uniref:YrrS family protein n=1 Tax=Solibacillus sp. FSL H8-0538 TaxID=2921400 RepID=UPI0030F60624
MAEQKRQFLTRREHSERKDHSSNSSKLDRLLNVLIAIVSMLIVISLVIILRTQDDTVSSAKEQKNDMQQQSEPLAEEPKNSSQEASVEKELAEDDSSEKSEGESSVGAQEEEAIVSQSDDPVVNEVQTNPSWQSYPTKQNGVHTSTYQKGHIDYEEKLGAAFSVTQLSPEASIVWNVKNNGSADTASVVVSSLDKTLKYRVSIEWVDGAGWKPVKLETLNTLEGAF